MQPLSQSLPQLAALNSASASAFTIYLCISLAGRTHRRLQGLDVACEICAATWQRHLRVPSEYGAEDFDGIPLECHRWVQLQTCNLLENSPSFLLPLAISPWLAHCQQLVACTTCSSQLATCHAGKLTTFCSPWQSLINWAQSLATCNANCWKYIKVCACVCASYLHMFY